MLGSIYNGLSGLIQYSKGLDIISNNVANLNTPGFKSSRVIFQDLFYSSEAGTDSESGSRGFSVGYGVVADKTSTQFTEGEFKNTRNQSDLAIEGNGFFIVEQEGQRFYTRAGQFTFNENGKFVVAASGASVLALDESGKLRDISIDAFRQNPNKPTSEIKFENNLSVDDLEHEINNIQVFDADGKQRAFKIVFKNNKAAEPGSWLVEVTDEKNVSVTTGEIRFQANGSPELDFNSLSFTYTSEGGTDQEIKLTFGEPGAINESTNLSGGANSTLRTKEIDGYAIGALVKTEFDDKGILTLEYSNGQKSEVARIALANFSFLQGLQGVGRGLFVSTPGQEITINYADEGPFGKIKPENIELSNVELTQQFTDMIVVQRGFQASSQVLTVANEMLQELINSRGQG